MPSADPAPVPKDQGCRKVSRGQNFLLEIRQNHSAGQGKFFPKVPLHFGLCGGMYL
jgi:hypothetical protein